MAKKDVSCKYNQECWLKHRLPLIKKHKIYLPYQCSFVQMGDMENCTLRDGFIERERIKKEVEGIDAVSAERTSTGNISG